MTWSLCGVCGVCSGCTGLCAGCAGYVREVPSNADLVRDAAEDFRSLLSRVRRGLLSNTWRAPDEPMPILTIFDQIFGISVISNLNQISFDEDFGQIKPKSDLGRNQFSFRWSSRSNQFSVRISADIMMKLDLILMISDAI